VPAEIGMSARSEKKPTLPSRPVPPPGAPPARPARPLRCAVAFAGGSARQAQFGRQLWFIRDDVSNSSVDEDSPGQCDNEQGEK
jgi:hypothetical protein